MNIPPPYRMNSAGRLLAVLDHLHSIGNGRTYEQCLPSWLDSELPKESTERIEVILGEIRTLFQRFIEDVSYSDMNPDQREVIIDGVPSVSKVLYPLAFNTNIPPINDGERALIRIAAVCLPQEDVVPEDEIAIIKNSIDTLFGVIKKAEISPSARKLLLELVRIAESSLRFYEIHGARGLKSAVKQMMGEMTEFYRESDYKQLENQDYWGLAKDLVFRLDQVASAAMKYKPLLEIVVPFLISGTGK